jgi:hypothetical protein
MDTHKNARLTPKGREEMVRAVVDRGFSKAEAARGYNTSVPPRLNRGDSREAKNRRVYRH